MQSCIFICFAVSTVTAVYFYVGMQFLINCFSNIRFIFTENNFVKDERAELFALVSNFLDLRSQPSRTFLLSLDVCEPPRSNR